MFKQKYIAVQLGAALLALAGSATGAEAPALPDTKVYADLPEPARQFVLAARKADGLPDRLQRCLAFPDMPGNRWGKDLARMQCEVAHGPAIALDTVIAKLDQGALAELEQLFRRDLERHFSSTDFSEVIHADFRGFQGTDPRGDEVSQRWLQLAPTSPFANFARGRYLAHRAWKARGNKVIGETTEAQVQEMDKWAAQAIDAMGKVLRLEPRMLPAHAALLDMAQMTSNAALEAETIRRAAVVDPGCYSVAFERMQGLEPKWGGNYLEMAAYAKQLEAHIGARPLIAVVIADTFNTLAEPANAKKDWAEAIALRLPASRLAPSPSVFFDLGLNYADLVTGASHDALLALLTANRFFQDEYWTLRSLGIQLFLHRDYAWAQRVLQATVKAEEARAPDKRSMRVQFLLGASLSYLQRYPEAIPYLTTAMTEPAHRQYALNHLTKAHMATGQLEQSKKISADHVREFPGDAEAWYNAIVLHHRLGDRPGQRAAMQGFLRVVDRSNAATAAIVAQVEKDLARDEPQAPKP